MLNLPLAMRYASNEYEKIKKSIITALDTTVVNGTVAEQLDTILLKINANKNNTMTPINRSYRKVYYWLGSIAVREPNLFAHWQVGVKPATR